MTRRWFPRAAFAFGALALVVVGGVTGVRPLPLLPGQVPEAAFAMTSFGAFVLLSGVLFVRRLRRGRRASPEPLDESVTAIVPTYRDADVLERSVESLLACAGDVGVTIVVEPDDDRGIAVARRYADRDGVEYIVNREPGSKAAAINDAVARSDGDVFAVFDADQDVPSDFFERVSGYLTRYDVVQARFLPRSTGLVESLTYYEYVVFNYCLRQPLYLTSTFRMATSKALLFTRSAFESVGGYDPEVVAEDADFGHRCYLDDLDVRLAYVPAVREEAAHTIRDWWGQRKRWMLGNVQVLHRLLTEFPGDLSRRRYVSLSVGLSSVGGAVALLSLVPKFAWLLAEGAYLVAAFPLLAIHAVAIAARATDEVPMDGGWLLAPAVVPLFGLVTLMAVADYLVGAEAGWFAVEKGE